jgi:hypothetical protein
MNWIGVPECKSKIFFGLILSLRGPTQEVESTILGAGSPCPPDWYEDFSTALQALAQEKYIN